MPTTFVCTTKDVDEAQDDSKPGQDAVNYWIENETVWESLMAVREDIPLGWYKMLTEKSLYKFLSFIAYAVEHPSRRRRQPMDVEKMVASWLPLVTKLATAHDVDEKDAASS